MIGALLTLFLLTHEPVLPEIKFTPNVVYIKVDPTKRKRYAINIH